MEVEGGDVTGGGESVQQIVEVEEYEENFMEDVVDDGGECDRYRTPGRGNGSSVVDGSSGVVALVEEPKVGMTFSSWEEVDTYYRSYGMQEGFGVVRAASGGVKSKEGGHRVRKNSTWTCECYGRPDRRRKVNGSRVRLPTDSQIDEDDGKIVSKKCECPVMIYASVNENKEWQLRKVVNEHKNHDKPTPGKSRYIHMYRKLELTNRVRRQLKLWRDAKLKPKQMHTLLALERNGLDEVGLSEKDVRNECGREKRLILKEGDANAMMAYFHKMTANNNNFCHTYRLDDEGMLQDVVWVDARSRVAYTDFSDVVCFDATYLTNEYELPFANFVGVNHHGQSMLLGCALVSRETAETYEWVFNAWLNFMGGKEPGGILTDQAPSMRKAISLTMPTSTHRWCIWHITQKFCTKLGKHPNYEELKGDLYSAIYDTMTPEEFEQAWCGVLEKHDLQDDEWLEGLNKEKEMWIPACLKHMFWAGMKTTQRVESINSFFDGYIHKHTRLYEFASSYILAMEARAESERVLDAHDARYTRHLLYDYPAESLFQKIYTDSKFKEVQRECERINYLRFSHEQKISDCATEYVLKDRVWMRCAKKKKDFVTQHRRDIRVLYDSSTNDLSCECRLFESTGIVCRHMIMVWDILGMDYVPDKYIIRRWRKDITRKHSRVKVAYHDPSKNVNVVRFDKLQQRFESIADKASKRSKLFDLALELLEKLDIRIDEEEANMSTPNAAALTQTPSSVGNNCNDGNKDGIEGGREKDAICDGRYLPTTEQVVLEHTPLNIKDPPVKKVPHRTRSKRFYSVVDLIQRGKALASNSKNGVAGGKGKGNGKGKGKGKGKEQGKGKGKGKGKEKEALAGPETTTRERAENLYSAVNPAPIMQCSPNIHPFPPSVYIDNASSFAATPRLVYGGGYFSNTPITPRSGVEMYDQDGSLGFFDQNSRSSCQRLFFPQDDNSRVGFQHLVREAAAPHTNPAKRLDLNLSL